MTTETPASGNHDHSHQRHLQRGFNWLGGATIIAKIIDFSTIFVVLLFLTKQQLGIASIVVSTGMVIEAFDGWGVSEALVQARSVSRPQLDTLFWFIFGAAMLVGGLTLLAAPLLAAIFGIAEMPKYFLAVAIKQPLVGMALIPLAMMNRDLRYERIATINVCATLAAALTRLGLAVAGAGVWAIVASDAASGLFVLIGAMLARPFRPQLRFRLPAILPLLRFGTRATASNAFEQMFKNVDYLLVGWFYGASSLAVYRVAFDIAMEPAMAAGTLVNRTALPVFARVSKARDDGTDGLAASLIWSLRRLVALIAPLMAGLILIADPLTALLHDRHGHSYAAAALPLKVLAAAGLLRVTSQLLYPALIGSGQPGKAARLAATTLLLLTIGILAVGFSFPARTGLIAVSAVWLGIYPPLLAWGAVYLRRRWAIPFGELARVFIVPLISVGAMSGIAEAAQLAGRFEPIIQIGIVLAAAALTYAGLLLHARRRRFELA